MAGFGARIAFALDQFAVDPVVFFVLLGLVELPERHGINAHPRAVLANARRADGFTIFARERGIRLDRD